MACEAARNGLGVAMAYEALCRGDIASGRLVMPFPTLVPANRAYYFLRYPQHEGFEPLEKFRSWLLAECRSPNA
jgi:LysR family glycine cleavage system transcriptional activator